MKKLSVFLLALLMNTYSIAYDWYALGPSDVEVNNFNTVFYNLLVEIICTSNGIMINEGESWTEYSYGDLPVWSAVELDPENILVLMGNGSWSDGIYQFNLTSHQFQVVEWIVNPHFLCFCDVDNRYYAGGEYGLWKSDDGLTFNTVEDFNTKECVAFAWHEEHFVVSTPGEIYYSSDTGQSWNQSQPAYFSELSFKNDGTLYGIFPGTSYSSGLWKSTDYGESWQVVVYSPLMTSLGMDIDGNIFVGWESNGVACWNTNNEAFEYYNDGLPDLNINKITMHHQLDCINIIACTDNGAYLLTSYVVGMEQINLEDQAYELTSYPNPFYRETTLVFSIGKTAETTLEIYDLSGQKVSTLFRGIAEQQHEYSFVIRKSDLNEGIYLCSLKSEGAINAVNKMLVIR